MNGNIFSILHQQKVVDHLSVFRDKFSEEMAYPGIFLGQGRPENDKRLTPVHYSEICKSELRRSDRRAAMCVENIF